MNNKIISAVTYYTDINFNSALIRKSRKDKRGYKKILQTRRMRFQVLMAASMKIT
jgi:hypothetical protein